MVVEWFCQVMGSEVGPLSQGQLIEMVRSHQLTPEDLVRRDGSNWVAAFEVKGLFEAAAKPPSASAPIRQHSLPPEANTKQSPAITTSHQNSDASRKHIEQRPGEAPPAVSSERMVGDDWFCIAAGQKMGPLSFNELQSLADEGKLRRIDRVWRSAAPKFRKAIEIDGLTLPD